ncbi:hypothetical protein QVD99_000635 [Batrachochytrium dendrobatidis]|nr:hypothetical protein O5D80_003487 [Batrachochytrium dendrobatidis]KAK5673180.1 hypothetical protein QVD99_000635 [Batrachochytrium dendrobatidis]
MEIADSQSSTNAIAPITRAKVTAIASYPQKKSITSKAIPRTTHTTQTVKKSLKHIVANTAIKNSSMPDTKVANTTALQKESSKSNTGSSLHQGADLDHQDTTNYTHLHSSATKDSLKDAEKSPINLTSEDGNAGQKGDLHNDNQTKVTLSELNNERERKEPPPNHVKISTLQQSTNRRAKSALPKSHPSQSRLVNETKAAMPATQSQSKTLFPNKNKHVKSSTVKYNENQTKQGPNQIKSSPEQEITASRTNTTKLNLEHKQPKVISPAKSAQADIPELQSKLSAVDQHATTSNSKLHSSTILHLPSNVDCEINLNPASDTAVQENPTNINAQSSMHSDHAMIEHDKTVQKISQSIPIAVHTSKPQINHSKISAPKSEHTFKSVTISLPLSPGKTENIDQITANHLKSHASSRKSHLPILQARDPRQSEHTIQLLSKSIEAMESFSQKLELLKAHHKQKECTHADSKTVPVNVTHLIVSNDDLSQTLDKSHAEKQLECAEHDREIAELHSKISVLQKRVLREQEKSKIYPKVTSIVPTSLEANIHLRHQFQKSLENERDKYAALEMENQRLIHEIRDLTMAHVKKKRALSTQEATHYANEVSQLRNKSKDIKSEKMMLEEKVLEMERRLAKEIKEKERLFKEMISMRRLQMHVSNKLDDFSNSSSIDSSIDNCSQISLDNDTTTGYLRSIGVHTDTKQRFDPSFYNLDLDHISIAVKRAKTAVPKRSSLRGHSEHNKVESSDIVPRAATADSTRHVQLGGAYHRDDIAQLESSFNKQKMHVLEQDVELDKQSTNHNESENVCQIATDIYEMDYLRPMITFGPKTKEECMKTDYKAFDPIATESNHICKIATINNHGNPSSEHLDLNMHGNTAHEDISTQNNHGSTLTHFEHNAHDDQHTFPQHSELGIEPEQPIEKHLSSISKVADLEQLVVDQQTTNENQPAQAHTSELYEAIPAKNTMHARINALPVATSEYFEISEGQDQVPDEILSFSEKQGIAKTLITRGLEKTARSRQPSEESIRAAKIQLEYDAYVTNRNNRQVNTGFENRALADSNILPLTKDLKAVVEIPEESADKNHVCSNLE